MKKVFFLSLLVLVALSCNKVEKNAAKMNGNWKIYSYTRITGSGFKTAYPVEGTVNFKEVGNGKLNYQENFVLDSSGTSILMSRTGVLTITGEKARSFELNLLTPTNVETIRNSIHLISKDDLKIEFHDNGVGHLFVLQKD